MPFTTESGYAGEITLILPQRLLAGDKTDVIARVNFNNTGSSSANILLTGRLETGVEELHPRGETQISVKTGTSVELVWQLRPVRKAVYPGNLWLSISTGTTEELLLVREVKFDSRMFMGTQAYNIRIAAGFVAVFGFLMALLSIFRPSK